MSNPPFVLHHPHGPIPRRTLRPPFLYGTLDPVLSRKRKAITPGSVLITAFALLYGAYATGNLPVADHAFNQFYAYTTTHNDAIVQSIVDFFPTLFVIWIIGMTSTVILLRINNRRRRQAFAAARKAKLNQPIAEPTPTPQPLTSSVITIDDPGLRTLPVHTPTAYSKISSSRVCLPTG